MVQSSPFAPVPPPATSASTSASTGPTITIPMPVPEPAAPAMPVYTPPPPTVTVPLTKKPVAVKSSSSSSSTSTSTVSPPEPMTVTVTARSAGFPALQEGYAASVNVNDHTLSLSATARGFHVVVFDTTAAKPRYELATFDTHADTKHSDRLADFLAHVPVTGVVAIVAVDDAIQALTPRAKAHLAALGARLIRVTEVRDAYALVAPVRTPRDAVEARTPAIEAAPTVPVALTFTLNAAPVPYLRAAGSPAPTRSTRLIQARAAGFTAGAFGEVVVDGIAKTYTQRGVHMIVIYQDRNARRVEQCFDTHLHPDESDRLVNHLEQLDLLPYPSAVLLVGVDDISRCLTERARKALARIGSNLVDYIGFQDGFVMMARSDAGGATVEAHSRAVLGVPTRWIEMEY
ncbi:hypothetical protein AMAG_08427 [Allomyces macrogynus ATCC 38327]|uniref:ILEI/PANDER domain-containing protein n=1 Tax=Allomyces macrogynus (strain ATCC 38327) TaxID=578462 RepID=A0A0L0SL44_ALLM3|nr:hypothetical protein AMAG_08427 [Allomyces macrogynus ATCC 38327]|eukprot:KNE63286.1 hypothetical protein AMAG_08427 [Allomyces macrogynus ATCC 38327]